MSADDTKLPPATSSTALPSVLDKPLSRGAGTAPLATFAYLFSAMLQYYESKVDHVQDIENGLHQAGYSIGLRLLDLMALRDKVQKREKNLVDLLSFIAGTVWKNLFGKTADGLERSNESKDVYYLFEKEPITNRFVSLPKDYSHMNCASFIAGIINGMVDAADFPVVVTANWNVNQTQTVYIIKSIQKT